MQSLHVWVAGEEFEERYLRKKGESRRKMLLKGKKLV
jgi:hypothetical protein